MRFGVLQCDSLDPPTVDVRGDYDVLYADVLASGGLAEGVETVTYRADRDGPPSSPTECDAWLIGGSRRSVYDEIDWILDLRRFVRKVIDSEVPLVGICFGHQMIGQELGARVSPAERGWMMGAVDYDLVAVPPGEPDGPRSLTLAASHRDQVHDLPDGATLLATADHTPVAGFTLGDHVLSIQPHPEFPADVATVLYRARAARVGVEPVERAVQTLAERPLDRARVGGWITSHAGARRAR